MLGGGPGGGAIVDADERDPVQARAAVYHERDMALAGQAQEGMALRQRPHDEPVDDGVREQGGAFRAVGIQRGDELQPGVMPRRAFRQPAQEVDRAGVLEGVRERLAEEQPDAAGPTPAQAPRRRIGAGVAELARRYEDSLAQRRAQ